MNSGENGIIFAYVGSKDDKNKSMEKSESDVPISQNLNDYDNIITNEAMKRMKILDEVNMQKFDFLVISI